MFLLAISMLFIELLNSTNVFLTVLSRATEFSETIAEARVILVTGTIKILKILLVV